jgi:hypothetical protein
METTGKVIRAADADINALQLGAGSQELVFDSRREVRDLAVALASQAQRSLLLHTHDLEPVIFDQLPFLDAAQDMVRRHRDSCFHILLQDGRGAVHNGNRLIEMARRLSTRIEIRRPQAEYLDFPATFLLADDSGYLHRPLYSRYEGTAGFNNPGTTLRLKRYFMEAWEHSAPDVEMRRLHL